MLLQVKIQGYSAKIKEPMWIKELQKKVDKGRYKRMEDFENDVELMFSNCAQFNYQDDNIYKHVSVLPYS